MERSKLTNDLCQTLHMSSLSANTIMAKLTSHFKQTNVID